MSKRDGTRIVSRRTVLKTAASAAVVTSAVGIAPRFLTSPARAQDGLASGMTGGPTGFPGAENYQYNESMSEGRAIEGIKQLKAAGKAPDKITMMFDDGAIGQLTKPFPEGAPTVKEVWERETGVEIGIVGMPNTEAFPKIMQDIATKTKSFDTYMFAWNNVGDFAEAGGLVNFDEYVAKYNPDFSDPERGYVGGDQGVELLAKYNGSYYCVSLDGDFQCWIFRKDLFEDAAEQAAFKEAYGYDLDYPQTWQQLDHASAFFHRPDQGLVGCSDLRNQGWGYTNWYQRYASMGAPNQFLFDLEGNPLIDSEAGVKATQEYVNSLKWHHADGITWGWPEQYGNMAEGGAAITCAFSNMPKFLDNPANEGSKVTGKMISNLPPGRMHGDELVRRSVLWYNISAGISTQSEYPEAAYLLLQWLGSSRIYSWMTANPGGYFDPFQLANFEDPLVQETYHAYHVKTIRETIKRSVPSINFAGTQSFHNALDENLLAALTNEKSAEEAMSDTTKDWQRIVRRQGEDKMVEAIKTNRAAWPTTVDTA